MAKFNIDPSSLGNLSEEEVDDGLDISKVKAVKEKETAPKKDAVKEEKPAPVKNQPKEKPAPVAPKKEKPAIAAEPSPSKTRKRKKGDDEGKGEEPALKGFTLKKSVADKLDFIAGMEKAMKGTSFNQSAYVNSLIEADIDKKLKELGYDRLYAEKIKNGK